MSHEVVRRIQGHPPPISDDFTLDELGNNVDFAYRSTLFNNGS